MPRELSIELQRFVETHLESVEHLEVLMFLARDPARFWNAKSIAQPLYLTEPEAARCLESLAKAGLLDVRLGSEVVYQFSPASPAMMARMKQLANAYVHSRSQVLTLASSRRRKSLKDLSDAFRLRRDRPDHG